MVRLLLEAYYEPTFSGHSHGFRPGRGCHTALRDVEKTWTGTVWFIEGDISDCFGSLDHEIMVQILAEKIHDNRFLRLVRNMLRAGYLEDWTYHETPSGAPQGGVISPLLSNIYLSKLDSYVETVLIPGYTRGKHRRNNPEYKRIESRMRRARTRGDRKRSDSCGTQLRTDPIRRPEDPGLPAASLFQVCRRSSSGVYRAEGRSRGNQSQLARFLRETSRSNSTRTKP